jgi:GxxExxY protein
MGLVKNAPHTEITFKVIGAAMAVHNELGPGHREEVYQNALALKMMQEPFCLAFETEYQLPVYNPEGNLLYVYRPDFLVENAVLLEIKAHHQPLNADELAQALDYFAASDFQVALLINFGRQRLDWQRLFPPKYIQAHRKSRNASQNS